MVFPMATFDCISVTFYHGALKHIHVPWKETSSDGNLWGAMLSLPGASTMKVLKQTDKKKQDSWENGKPSWIG